ncbi:DUF1700 domain-containing protein [Lactobacillus sp. ESL0791]|uniref:DUF1700 domain-containing protein n=1 Tax=Lactobacillus sp. ESL0791 TaxID=2983234 RepID=UPI0023F6B59D|nr:DUF1700 domain-containing protein [Lactobacillus sp. ESL0791]MDF7637918.1 DUF1700 domain-containing protein [Lactobacillus sp. ESL0791]
MEQVINDYILELEQNLSVLPENDRQDVVEFYREFLLDGNFHERQAIEQELGSPQQLAHKIIADYSVSDDGSKSPQQPQKDSSKHLLKTIWYTLLGICAAPVGIPIIIAILAIIIAVLAVCLGIFIGFIALIAGLIGGGIFALVTSIRFIPTTDWAVGLFYTGAALAIIGFALLLIPILIKIVQFLIAKCATFAHYLGRKLFKKHYYQTKKTNGEE